MDNNTENIDFIDVEEREQSLAEAQAQFKKKYKFKVLSHGFADTVIFAVLLVIAFFIISSFFSISTIRGNGMAPTVTDKNYVVVNKMAYIKREPCRGDIISSGGRIFRIIGLPDETVSFNGGHIYIDNHIAEETYLQDTIRTSSIGDNTSITVPENGYLVLCDNRSCTDDSRKNIFVNRQDIDGKIITII